MFVSDKQFHKTLEQKCLLRAETDGCPRTKTTGKMHPKGEGIGTGMCKDTPRFEVSEAKDAYKSDSKSTLAAYRQCVRT